MSKFKYLKLKSKFYNELQYNSNIEGYVNLFKSTYNNRCICIFNAKIDMYNKILDECKEDTVLFLVNCDKESVMEYKKLKFKVIVLNKDNEENEIIEFLCIRFCNMILTNEKNLYLKESYSAKFTPLILFNDKKDIIEIKNKDYNKMLEVFK